MITIKRALISVSDKSGLEDFVKGLNEFGVEIISTGGTANFIQKLNIPVKTVADFTGAQEMLDGRVKTLHPKIHAALLALRDNVKHIEQISQAGIELIDMVVVNLYPFENIIQKDGVSLEEAIENIDIGGPSMLRSAAKNSKNIAVISNPHYYNRILTEMKENNGQLTGNTCFELAVEAFARTSYYDRIINSYLKTKIHGFDDHTSLFPDKLDLQFDKMQTLRYGENPHQQAAFYRDCLSKVAGVSSARQMHGKELSFNNILDLDAALNIVKDFSGPAVTIVKHTNPCGVAVAEKLKYAYKDALEGDPVSAFGGIIGANRKIDRETAQEIIDTGFVECIIAPGYEQDALDKLKMKKNIRIMEIDNFRCLNTPDIREWDLKKVSGGLLVQDKDVKVINEKMLKVVTRRQPSKEEIESLIFAWAVVKNVKSNAIVLAKQTKLVGVGAGQMSRVDSVIIAIRKSAGRCQGAVLASDAFFPKQDAVIEAAQAGITAIIQPGGSINDPQIIDTADKYGIGMLFTGMRHFKH